MRVGDAMTSPAVIVPPEMPVQQVARTMIERGTPAVAVASDDGELLGLISESDLVVRNANLHFPAYLGLLELIPIGGDRDLEDELRRALAATAADVMTDKVYTVGPDDDLGEVVHDMLHKRIHAVPVIGRGRIAGILFPSDVVKLIARDIPV